MKYVECFDCSKAVEQPTAWRCLYCERALCDDCFAGHEATCTHYIFGEYD